MTTRTLLIAFAVVSLAGAAQAQDMGDLNNDGRLTRAEARAARAAMFDRLDANHDNAVSAEERAAAQRGRRAFDRADANNDGRVSRAEFESQPMRLFDRFDADNNDVLDAEELAAMRAMAQRLQR